MGRTHQADSKCFCIFITISFRISHGTMEQCLALTRKREWHLQLRLLLLGPAIRSQGGPRCHLPVFCCRCSGLLVRHRCIDARHANKNVRPASGSLISQPQNPIHFFRRCPNESSVPKNAMEKESVPKGRRRVALMTDQSGAKVRRRG